MTTERIRGIDIRGSLANQIVLDLPDAVEELESLALRAADEIERLTGERDAALSEGEAIINLLVDEFSTDEGRGLKELVRFALRRESRDAAVALIRKKAGVGAERKGAVVP
jgi:hypothetical protein